MKLSVFLVLLAIVTTSVSAVHAKRDIDPTLIPDLGVTAGQNPDGICNF